MAADLDLPPNDEGLSLTDFCLGDVCAPRAPPASSAASSVAPAAPALELPPNVDCEDDKSSRHVWVAILLCSVELKRL